jgi:hypothetical protein
MKNLLKIFALIAKNLSKMGVTLKEVEILKFSSTGFSSLIGFFGKVKFLETQFFTFSLSLTSSNLRFPQNLYIEKN